MCKWAQAVSAQLLPRLLICIPLRVTWILLSWVWKVSSHCFTNILRCSFHLFKASSCRRAGVRTCMQEQLRRLPELLRPPCSDQFHGWLHRGGIASLSYMSRASAWSYEHSGFIDFCRPSYGFGVIYFFFYIPASNTRVHIHCPILAVFRIFLLARSAFFLTFPTGKCLLQLLLALFFSYSFFLLLSHPPFSPQFDAIHPSDDWRGVKYWVLPSDTGCFRAQWVKTPLCLQLILLTKSDLCDSKKTQCEGEMQRTNKTDERGYSILSLPL